MVLGCHAKTCFMFSDFKNISKRGHDFTTWALSFRYTQYALSVCTYYLNPPTHPVQLSTILGNPPTLPKGVRNMYTVPKRFLCDFDSKESTF